MNHIFKPKDPSDPPLSPRVCGVCGYTEGYYEETPTQDCQWGVYEVASNVDKCECGGAKVGYKKGEVGHSRWCNWHTDKVKK